ncbi:MAG: PAS domain S-box protein [Gammaproteobacteria bacterium]|nr:PAS domain S-box protein [Gammaproteobacteria bacterium]
MGEYQQESAGVAYDFEILVVEDSEDHCELIRRAFSDSSMNVTARYCGSIAEARQRLAESVPDLVLADIRLPDGDGKTLISNAGQRAPLVLMTSFGDETQAVNAIKAGALDYVVKLENSFAELPSICWRAVRDWRVRLSAKEAQQALALSEKRYRTLFENVPAGIFQCDKAGILTEVNPGLVSMLAYPDAESMLGLHLFRDLFVDDGALPRNIRSMSSSAGNETHQVRIKRYGGGECVAALSIKPVQQDGRDCCYEGFIFDQTRQFEADAALAETRLRMEAAFRNVFGFIVLVDPQGSVLDMSDSVIAATGCVRSEVEGRPLWLAPWWRDLDGEAESVKTGIASALSGESVRDRAKFAIANGDVRIGDRSFNPISDDQGRVRFIVVEGRDISELIDANEKLEESEQRFRRLFEEASEALVVYDLDTNGFIDLNGKMERLFASDKSELLGKNALTLSPEFQPGGKESSALLRHHMKLALAGETPVFEWEFLTLSGKQITSEVRLSRMLDGQRTLVRGSITDIGVRKEAERRLRESQQRMSALVENATIGILEIDEENRVMSANPVAVAMLAKNDATETTGSGFLSYVPYESRSQVRQALGSAWRGHDSSLVFPLTAVPDNRIISGSIVAIRGNTGEVSRVILMCDDITDRHVNARRLEAERQFTESVVNSLPGSFFVFEENGALVRFNDRFFSANGFTRVEAEQMRPLDFIADEDKAAVATKLREIFELGEASVEAHVSTKHGLRIPYSFSGRALEQDGKRFVVGFGLDISERRRNESRFRAEKKFGDTVINSMPGVFYVVSEERRIVRWNDNLLKMIGKRADEMATVAPMNFVAEQDREAVAKGLQKVFEDGEARVEASFLNANGEENPFLLTGIRLHTDNGVFMVGMGFDISERKVYEAQLRASENYLRSVVESEPECVWTLDREGRITDINPAGRMMLGDALVERASSTSIAEFIRREQREAFLQLNESVFSGHSGILVFGIETGNGTVRWLETHAVALRDGDGRIEGHLAVTRDISEKRNAEAKIQKYSDRLQKLSQKLLDTQEAERRHLARELHDEVGQSLTALKLNLGHGMNETPGRLANPSDSMLIIDRVLEQIRNLSLNLRPAILDDFGLLPALRWYVDNQAARAAVRARLSADSLTGVRLQSDIETAAFRIVQEALTNVLRHAQARSVEIEVEIRNDRLSIKIHDDGKGFDAFEQMRKAASGGSFGLLGLKERAGLLGGAAFIESSPGAGATVAAWLPLVESEVAQDISPAGLENNSGDKTISRVNRQ